MTYNTLNYVAPDVTVTTFVVERGFEHSNDFNIGGWGDGGETGGDAD